MLNKSRFILTSYTGTVVNEYLLYMLDILVTFETPRGILILTVAFTNIHDESNVLHQDSMFYQGLLRCFVDGLMECIVSTRVTLVCQEFACISIFSDF